MDRKSKITEYRRMDPSKKDLHGSAPDKSDIPLFLIDVINDLDFTEPNQPHLHALPMAKRNHALKARARRADSQPLHQRQL